MILFLTSSPYLYQHDPATLNPDNEFVERLHAVLPHRPKTLFIASNPDDHEGCLEFIHVTKDAFGRAGIPLGRCTVLDGRNARWAYRLVAESEFIIIMGGHVPTQNEFFRRIRLRRYMKKFDGVVMGISAGSMNSADTVYVQPEEEGESSPDFPRTMRGLGLADINILPHYQQVKDYELDGQRLYEDITYADSFGRELFIFPDGSYYYQDDEESVILGEAYRLTDGEMEQLTENGERFDFM